MLAKRVLRRNRVIAKISRILQRSKHVLTLRARLMPRKRFSIERIKRGAFAKALSRGGQGRRSITPMNEGRFPRHAVPSRGHS
jgi:hypothetical protein